MFPECPSNIHTVLGTIRDTMMIRAQALPQRRSSSSEREAVVVIDKKASC